MTGEPDLHVEYIPIDSITIVNPRSRGANKYKQVVANIGNIGLKKPITVTRRERKNGHTRYELVCGQGRLEAYRNIGSGGGACDRCERLL